MEGGELPRRPDNRPGDARPLRIFTVMNHDMIRTHVLKDINPSLGTLERLVRLDHAAVHIPILASGLQEILENRDQDI